MEQPPKKPDGERRDPVPESANYWLRSAKQYRDEHNYSEAFHCLEQAYNHVVNAAFAEAEERDKLQVRLDDIKSCAEDRRME